MGLVVRDGSSKTFAIDFNAAIGCAADPPQEKETS